MKILELRFTNLNSLCGEWCIDFTHPDYGDGLFAITGATGSGKTTILDALCLALYGQTPRLKNMNKGENEAMSRKTGECSAEVRFETMAGVFRATWQQRRARKKAEGALQSPVRELADGKGLVLATKLREVQSRVDEITGMNFDQFTRSILLAQGSFDTFLKAKADERSPILEQITGTEIYTEISKRVHLRYAAENQQMATLTAGLDGIQLLDEAALDLVNQELIERKASHVQLGKERDAAKASLDAAARILDLERSLEQNRVDQQALSAELIEFAPEADRLAAAKRALPLAGTYAQLEGLRAERNKILADETSVADSLPDLLNAQATSEKAFGSATLELEQAAAKQKELAPVLTAVRELDTQLAGQVDAQKKASDQLDELRTEKRELAEKEAAVKLSLQTANERAATSSAYLKDHAQDEKLVGQLAAIKQSIAQLTQLTDQCAGFETASKTAAEKAKKLSEVAVTEKAKLATAKAAFEKSDAEASSLKTELEALRGETDWSARLVELQQRAMIEARIVDNNAKLVSKGAEEKAAADSLGQLKKEQGGALERQQLLIENLELLQTIKSLEEQRDGLVDGAACPLCGALEHPFADPGSVPVRDESALDLVTAELKSLDTQIGDLTKKLGASTAMIGSLREALAEDDAALKALAPGDAAEVLAVTERIAAIETLDARFAKATKLFDVARDEYSAVKLAEQSAAQSSVEAQNLARLAVEDLGTAKVERDRLHSELEQILAPFTVSIAPETESDLTKRRDAWVLAKEESVQLKESLAKWTADLAGFAGQLDKLETRVSEQSDAVTEGERSIHSLQERRFGLFGEQAPDAVEQEITRAVDAASVKSDAARALLTDCNEKVSLARQTESALKERKTDVLARLDLAEPLIIESLAAAKFESESAFLASNLSEPDREALERRAAEFTNRQTHLKALASSQVDQLEKERGQEWVETSAELHAELVEQCNELQRKVGTLNAQLIANEDALKLHAGKLDEIERQRVECARWNTLHGLIGSADGKKFRNFAQGLTFELMVSHANQQLAKMSDRYLLVRDLEAPLDLNVVDQYQAGEIRPVKNLSGGESFVVSLSLALGLSRMASQRVRVDSLFLDEGFGTLDGDALETALSALAELKQDGKLIGVISHVDALKASIPTQIHVHAKSDGRSTLSGAGVSVWAG